MLKDICSIVQSDTLVASLFFHGLSLLGGLDFEQS